MLLRANVYVVFSLDGLSGAYRPIRSDPLPAVIYDIVGVGGAVKTSASYPQSKQVLLLCERLDYRARL